MRILVADDDKEICDLLEIYIKNEGYEVEKAHDGQEVIDKVQRLDIDCLILDVMMPKKSGLEVVKEIRGISSLPVLMLSAKTADIDKIRGLTNGADDYVVKPFNPLEVLARVKSLIRRSTYGSGRNESGELEVGPLIIRKDQHQVETIEGVAIQLTALEFGILYLLATNLDRVFSADDIFEKVWKQESLVPAKTVMVHVSHLRDKIEKATGGESIVKTVWGVGYKIES
ncbi:MAG: response regulator transcription factor [Alkalibacterium sp.]|uniref:response regulator transcription factor n=1 Tax=Alkalibacterium TaxID=99906 RepID=UPI000EC3D394|nr:response regulator transcription factor [Alkalibacterium sp.]MDN6294175.1 response regulator transcription factor [Alkalibacterium sp.]MDN6295025.1 response regulator transcription factor [Alkalibacterium sp.]MDN6326506.1 response regulator transcription factor [Alkalibacterium sp.]MDN6398107.1 response regulator transcription factor [Alkalibacterium sp.]MDN6728747.1 response regulator transcription factor [Alkalibacterium sp.]